MAYGVFMHKHDSIYDDVLSKQYQFPKQYLSRAKEFINDWIVYLEPSGVRNTRGYFAIAKVQTIVPDPNLLNMYRAIITPGTYLDFGRYVPFKDNGQHLEKGLLNAAQKMSGRAQSAVRPISANDFERIIEYGLNTDVSPHTHADPVGELAEEPRPIGGYLESARVKQLTSRKMRDKNFRKIVLTSYENTCAITGLRLINGGGKAEAEAAHIMPIEYDGPDIVSNGIALSRTAHWMFDRGLIGLSNDLEILISRQANDRDTIKSMINSSGQLRNPTRMLDRPHPEFINWHRDHCFKN